MISCHLKLRAWIIPPYTEAEFKQSYNVNKWNIFTNLLLAVSGKVWMRVTV